MYCYMNKQEYCFCKSRVDSPASLLLLAVLFQSFFSAQFAQISKVQVVILR